MSNLRSVTEAAFDADVIASSRPVLVDFWAEWCGPCKALAPTLEKVSEHFAGAVDFVKVNVDEHSAVRDRFGVRGIPTLILLKGGQELGRVVGNRSAVQLAGFLDTHLGTVTELARATVILRAFGGEQQAKAKHLHHLREHIAQRQATPSDAMWDGRITSALRFVADAAYEDDCARGLGIPTEVVLLVEGLSKYSETEINAALFCAEWLESVPVGANLSKLPGAVLVSILRSQMVVDLLEGDPELLRICDRLASMHDAELGGKPVPESDWMAVKKGLVDMAANAGDSNRGVLAATLAYASSSLARDSGFLVGFISKLTQCVWKRLRHECHWTPAEDARIPQLAKEIAEAATARGEQAPRGEEMTQRIETVDPDLARRFRYHYNEGTRAMRQMGKRIGGMLTDLTRRSV